MRQLPALLLVVAIAYLLALALTEAPAFGRLDVPARNEVMRFYVDEECEQSGIPNTVTAIIFDYRGYDTMGEATVLFTAVGAAAAVLAGHSGVLAARPMPASDDVILRMVSRMVIPFVQIFGIYVIVYGHLSPGGGFAGGTILGGSMALYLFVFGPKRTAEKLPLAWGEIADGAAAFWYVLVGLGGILLGANFLANAAAGVPLGVQGQLFSGGTIWLIGLGVGVKVAATIINLLVHLAGET
ncbi:MAG TPA: hydrogen gas-evolving membrane-bound hydrogenase subunit E [Bacillota bacterium]|nr:hydrogen gas-evolving membrane-bound hydrogenase subunit E [Bacillota bacterium]